MTTETAPLPLLLIQPVPDPQHGWTALRLCAEAPLELDSLVRVVHGYGMAEILIDLPCMAVIAPASYDGELACRLNPARLRLLVEPGAMQGPGWDSQRSEWQSAGFPLTASDALPEPPAPAVPLKGDGPAKGLLLKLMSLVTSDADSDDIEAVIKRDPNLSFQLLKLVNSVAFAPGKKITSFGQAITLLGRRQLQRWLQLLLYARQPGSQAASPLLPRAAFRAGLMEALAKRRQFSHEMQDHAFMTGMFSLLDQLFGSPLADVIEPLSLPEEVVAALVRGEGTLGPMLAMVKAGDMRPTAASFATLKEALAATGISPEDWAAALVEAMRWAVQVSKEA